MKVSEFRIGNLVYMDNDVVNITGIVKSGFYFGEKGYAINILEWWKPIIITEKHLVVLGFEEGHPGYYSKGNMIISVEGQVYFGESETHIAEVFYIHKLQNLYYELHNEELVAEPAQIAQTI